MVSAKKDGDGTFNRLTGLLIVEVRHSNPNGDPDAESEPRTIESDGRGLISPVSFKRKVRDLIDDKEGPVWSEATRCLPIKDANRFGILEKRYRKRDEIAQMDAATFTASFWDARIFGNTFLESIKGKKEEGDEEEGKVTRAETDHFISTGVVQFGPGISVAPIEVERLTMTNKAGVQEGKDRGMAPLGWRVVRHALYTMPFFVNPMMARKSACDPLDIELLMFLLPHVYSNTASAIRPSVEIRHAWCAEHKNPLGACPDFLILDALAPKKTGGDTEAPSISIDDYEIPQKLPEDILERLQGFEDLCIKNWR